MIGIYKITSPSGKIYIGQSRNIFKRFIQYRNIQNCKDQTRLYRSFIKHGVENHVFEVLEECYTKHLNERERFWQDHYDVLSVEGLNSLLQECTTSLRVFSPITIVKMSEAKRGTKHPNYGKCHKTETIEKMSRLKVGINNPFYGKKHSNESLLKISKSSSKIKGELHYNFGKTLSLNTKNKISKIKSKLVLDTQTGIFYDSPREACIAFNIKLTTLRNYLNGSRPNKTTLIYV